MKETYYARHRQERLEYARKNPKKMPRSEAEREKNGYKRWFDVVVDHVIPLSRGGEHAPDNLQIVFRVDNSRKSNRMDYHIGTIFV